MWRHVHYRWWQYTTTVETDHPSNAVVTATVTALVASSTHKKDGHAADPAAASEADSWMTSALKWKNCSLWCSLVWIKSTQNDQNTRGLLLWSICKMDSKYSLGGSKIVERFWLACLFILIKWNNEGVLICIKCSTMQHCNFCIEQRHSNIRSTFRTRHHNLSLKATGYELTSHSKSCNHASLTQCQ